MGTIVRAVTIACELVHSASNFYGSFLGQTHDQAVPECGKEGATLRQLLPVPLESQICMCSKKPAETVAFAFSKRLISNGRPKLRSSAQPGGTSHLIKVSARSSREQAKDLRKRREVSSAVSLTCFGGVSSELPLTASQVLEHHGVVPRRLRVVAALGQPVAFAGPAGVEERQASLPPTLAPRYRDDEQTHMSSESDRSTGYRKMVCNRTVGRRCRGLRKNFETQTRRKMAATMQFRSPSGVSEISTGALIYR
jgi:hypothetical protein